MNSDIKISWNNPEKRGRPIFSWRVWVPTETPHRSCLISYLILIGYWSIAANYVSLRIFTDRNLCYSGAAFEPRTPPLFDWQTRNFSTINQQWILWLFTKSYGYVSKFLDYQTFSFWEVLNFSPPQRYSANNFISRNNTQFIYSRSQRS